MKDSSLRVPPGMDGTVIDVQRVHPRRHREGQARARRSRKWRSSASRRTSMISSASSKAPSTTACARQLVGKAANGGPGGLKKGAEITDDYLDGLKKDEWFAIRMKDEDVAEFLERAQEQIKRHKEEFDKRFKDKQAKITAGDDLAPGVLKMVKVYPGREASHPAGRQDGWSSRQQGCGVDDRAGRGHAVLRRRYAGRHRAEPARRAFAYEHRPDSRNASGLGREGPGREDPAHARGEGKVAQIRKFLDQIYNHARWPVRCSTST